MRRTVQPIAIAGLVGILVACGGPRQTVDPGKEAQAYYMMGVSHLRDQNPTQALKEFLKAERIDADNVDLQSALGQTYLLKGAYDLSEIHFKRALEISPNSPEVKNNLGALYLSMQRWDDAIKYFRMAIADLLFTSPEVAHTGLGFAQFKKGNFVDAIASYRQAVSTNPDYAPAYYRLGETYYALDKLELAVEELNKALRLAPNYADAHYRLALCLMKKKEGPQAAAHFREVIRLAPDSENAALSQNYLKLLQ